MKEEWMAHADNVSLFVKSHRYLTQGKRKSEDREETRSQEEGWNLNFFRMSVLGTLVKFDSVQRVGTTELKFTFNLDHIIGSSGD